MKKKILYGTLLFIVGMAMVACGDKNSGSDATPQQLAPAIPVVSGQLDGTGCPSGTCTYTGNVYVDSPEAFIRLGSVQRFNFNNSNGISGSNIKSLSDFLKALIGTVQIGLEFNTEGDYQVGWGFTGGTNTANGTGALLAIPASGTFYPGNFQLQASGTSVNVVGSYTLPNGTLQTFVAVPVQQTTQGIVFADVNNHIGFVAQTTSATVTQMQILYLGPNNETSVAGRFVIQKRY